MPTVYQIVVYTRYNGVHYSDFRVITYGLSVLFLCHSFIHYGFLASAPKSMTLFLIEIQRNILFSLVFYYYIDKAYSLLKNRKEKKLLIQFLFIISMSIIFAWGL